MTADSLFVIVDQSHSMPQFLAVVTVSYTHLTLPTKRIV